MVNKSNFPTLSAFKLQTLIGGSKPISDEENYGNPTVFFSGAALGMGAGVLVADATYTPRKKRKKRR